MAIANRGAYPNELDKSIDKAMMAEYIEYPTQFTNLAKQMDAPAGKSYTESEITGLSTMREIPEGTGVEFDIPEEGNKKTVYYTKWGMGFQYTEESKEDTVHNNLGRIPETMAAVARNRQEVEFWNLFNNATSETAKDGTAIVADGHTTLKSGDTIDNKGTADLSETALQAAFEYFWELVSQEGFPQVMNPDTLLVPTELTWIANRLYKQLVGVGSLNENGTNSDVWESQEGQIMTVNPQHGVVSWTPMVVRYLTDANNWFLLDKNKFDGRMLWKHKPRTEAGDDFATGNRMYKLTQRFLTFMYHYEPVYGGIVA